jgi:hypothetical protein
MTSTELAQVILAIATLIGSLSALVVAIRTGQKVDTTHALVNGRTSLLLDATAAAARSKGVQEGIDQERDRPPSKPV